MSINFEGKCRICLCKAETMYNLFDDLYNGCTLADIAGQLFDSEELKVQRNDSISSTLCETCTNTLINFFNLKATFEENSMYLKKILNNLKDDGNDDPEGGEHEHSKSECTETESNKNTILNLVQISKDTQNLNITVKPTFKSLVDDDEEETFIIIQEDDEFENELTLHENIVNYKIKSITETEKGGYHDEQLVVNQVGSKVKSNEKNLGNNEMLGEGMSSDDSSFEVQEYNKYSCPFCIKYFYSFKHFLGHMQDCHQTYSVTPYMYCTPVQIKVKKTQQDTSSKLQEYTCLACDKKMTDKDTFQSHIESHRDFVCELCGMKFSKKSYLNDHMEVHRSERKFKCEVCNKTFKRRSILVKHRRIHFRPNEVVCEYCGRTFNDKGTMKTHINLVHVRERNFKCLLCGLTFPLKATLNKHILRHDKDREKLYTCEKCNISYKDDSSLRRHNIMKHSEQTVKFTCEFCGKHYTSITNLKRHKRKHHNAILNTS